MDRDQPATSVDPLTSVAAFSSTAFTMLRSTGEVSVERLEEAYRAMAPVIHSDLDSTRLDTSVIVYTTLRLPVCITDVRTIVLGQSTGIFTEGGHAIEDWVEVASPARRRRALFDGKHTLAMFIASRSDIDDLIPTLTALQIEWNKAHVSLSSVSSETLAAATDESIKTLCEALQIESAEFARLRLAWGDDTTRRLTALKERTCSFRLRNLEASYCRYRHETDRWWGAIADQIPDIGCRPIYFVSSNTHSLINVLSGFAQERQEHILSFARETPELVPIATQWDDAAQQSDSRACDNILYYLLKKVQQIDGIAQFEEARLEFEHAVGITRIHNKDTLDIPAQVIEVDRLATDSFDHGLRDSPLGFLKRSDALILNIDYPLGRTAYFVLAKLAERAQQVRGVYIIGKAASLTADVGDILIPSSVVDQHTGNTYILDNCLRVEDVVPFVTLDGSRIYDNQKAVTVLGTFLQNRQMLNRIIANGVTDIEMESGPYLSALYEMLKPKRYPEGETVSFGRPSLDLGIVHYVSDNPVRGKRLGDNSLSFGGMEGTYAATLSVAARMLRLESARVNHG